MITKFKKCIKIDSLKIYRQSNKNNTIQLIFKITIQTIKSLKINKHFNQIKIKFMSTKVFEKTFKNKIFPTKPANQ